MAKHRYTVKKLQDQLDVSATELLELKPNAERHCTEMSQLQAEHKVSIEELEAKLAAQIAICQEKERLLNTHVRDSKHKDELLKGAMAELGKGKVQRDARQALCKATSFLTNRLLELTEQVDGPQRDEYDY